MATLSAREICEKSYGKSKDIFATRILHYGKLRSDVAYELGAGRGLFNQPVWTVSIAAADEKTDILLRILGSVFQSPEAAQRHIEKLKATPSLLEAMARNEREEHDLSPLD